MNKTNKLARTKSIAVMSETMSQNDEVRSQDNDIINNLSSLNKNSKSLKRLSLREQMQMSQSNQPFNIID